MDPLTALGLASNVIQILDFAVRVADTTAELVSSSTDAVPEVEQASTIVTNSQSLANDAPSIVSSGGLSQREKIVHRLASHCNTLATDLAKDLDTLRIPRKANGKLSISGAAKKIVQSQAWRNKIKSKQAMLQRAEGQLAVGLMSLLRNEQHANFQNLETNIETNHDEVVKAILGAKDDILDALQRQQHLLRIEQEAFADDLRGDQRRIEAQLAANSDHLIELTALSKRAWETVATEAEKNMATKVTNSLRFAELRTRRDVIEAAAHETFGWSFDHQTPLTSWLGSDSRLFWVTGKAGSGKSTLMKYLANSEQTRTLLEKWSGGHSVCIVDVYFWYPGSPMQRSELGLLQTMLCQIFEAFPSLIRVAAPRRWEAARDIAYQPELWTREELSDALDIVASGPLGHEDVRFCFFIDGLDEFHGHHLRLIRQIRQLMNGPRTKAVVSSGPWNVFANEFGGMKSQLRLEDLTRPDIRKYVNGELGWYIREHPEAMHLVYDISEKASGVFLWVYLTVRSLQESIVEGDSPTDLRRRLESYPTELDEFFTLILKLVDSFYRKSTAQALELAMIFAGRHPIKSTFLDFWNLTSEHRTTPQLPAPKLPDFSLGLKMSICPHRELRAMCIHTRIFLARTTKGLLHLPYHIEAQGPESFDPFEPSDWPQVEFLHRTVYEFLDSTEQRRLISDDTPGFFKDEDFLGKVMLARLKVFPIEAEARNVHWVGRIGWMLDQDFLDDEFVSNVEEVAAYYLRRFRDNILEPHVLECFSAFGHLTVVKSTQPTEPVITRVLRSTLGFSPYNRFQLFHVDSGRLREVLQIGANPNATLGFETETVWQRFVSRWRAMILLPGSQVQRTRLETVWQNPKILLEFGADVHALKGVRSSSGLVRRGSLPVGLLETQMPASITADIRSVFLSAEAAVGSYNQSTATPQSPFVQEPVSYVYTVPEREMTGWGYRG